MKGAALAIPLAALPSNPAFGGSYWEVQRRSRAVEPTDGSWVGPYSIVHPPGYNGSGGLLRVRVCTLLSAEPAVGPLQDAMRIWNNLLPISENCENCYVHGDPVADPPVSYNARGILLHELGHCALGLEHINLVETADDPRFFRTGSCDVNNNGACGETTNFTASVNATDVLLGIEDTAGDAYNSHTNACPFIPLLTSGQPGANASERLHSLNLCEAETCPPEVEARAGSGRLLLDTDQCTEAAGATCLAPFPCPDPPVCCPPCPGAECPIAPMDVLDVAWFRRQDNDPFLIESTPIDQVSMSRSVANLPVGHSYAASANRLVGEALGYPSAQSVMYTTRDSDTIELGLAADDANMVLMGRSGANRDAGDADDYEVQLVFTRNCATADVEVGYFSLGGAAGSCLAQIALSFDQPGPVKLHYSLVPSPPFDKTSITLNSDLEVDFGTFLFMSTFEGEDLTEWSSATP